MTSEDGILRENEPPLGAPEVQQARNNLGNESSLDDSDEKHEKQDPHPYQQRRPSYKRRQTSSAFIEDADRVELHRLATQLSRRQSTATGALSRVHTLITIDENDPAIDPLSDQFDLLKWGQNFSKNLQNAGISATQTGVSYKNLDIFGTGSALQVQETVLSTILAPLRMGNPFSRKSKAPKQILHGFDGLLRSGELLIVLGRPGSGCSTLLKSICGELYGLSEGAESKIHYDGIPQKQMKKEFKGEAIYNQEVSFLQETHRTR